MFHGLMKWDSFNAPVPAPVMPATNDRGINSLNWLIVHPFCCLATETVLTELAVISAALPFTATKSTDASSSASRKTCRKNLRHISRIRVTAAFMS
ncbi:hypothetical protein MRX96_006922 [Rhipicephalus microplus]